VHYEYGNSDDRVIQRALSKRQQHESQDSSSASLTTSTQPNVSSNGVTWEVDADRFSLASLLEPPAAPFVKQDDHSPVVSTTPPSVIPSSSRIATKTNSVITPLQSIQDYNHHRLNNNNSNNSNQLKLIRFTAPLCQVCRSLTWPTSAWCPNYPNIIPMPWHSFPTPSILFKCPCGTDVYNPSFTERCSGKNYIESK